MTDAAIYYDPYDFEIDDDPYPVWRRLREEAPLYYNDEHDFYAVSRFGDVDQVLKDWETYSSELGGTSLQDLTPEELEARKSMLDTDPPPHTRNSAEGGHSERHAPRSKR